MSGGSQHNPNGRQAPLGAGWSPLQLQVANFLARAPQAHMAPERGVTWHTPTPPPHLYHVPAPSPPDPLQAMKASGNSVFRHTATPPELYRHTPTPPDKHLLRHTPSPGDVKTERGAGLPPAELYPLLGQGREKLRSEDLLAYGRGVDLSVDRGRGSNGAPAHAPAPHAPHAPAPAPLPPALSVRDAPTINSLIALAQPRPGHARVDALLERLSSPALPAPASPHSVIVHSRAQPTPSPPSSNEDSADSAGAPPGSKRKRKPERTIRLTAPPPAISPAPCPPLALPPARTPPAPRLDPPVENGDARHTKNGPEDSNPTEKREKQEKPLTPPQTHENPPISQPKQEIVSKPPSPLGDSQNLPPPAKPQLPTPNSPKKLPNSSPSDSSRRKTRSNSSETIDDIAAMVASDIPVETAAPVESDPPVTIDKLKSVLTSPDKERSEPVEEPKKSPPKLDENKQEKKDIFESAAAPKRRSARTSNSETSNAPVESPSEAKPAEPEASEGRSAEPTAASFVEVENQLEKMFAGIEEPPTDANDNEEASSPKKRRKSAPTKGEAKAGRRAKRASTGDGRRKGGKKKSGGKGKKKEAVKDAYDSGSNASSSRSRGPYIQIRGPGESPLSVAVMNAAAGDDDEPPRRRAPPPFRNGLRAKGLHASTLGLRYDATTPDATWLCAFCLGGPHHSALGDLFGPYTVHADPDSDTFRSLDEATRRRYETTPSACEVWFHEACAVWAPGLVAAGARLWGLDSAVWTARAARCNHCTRPGAGIACSERHCRARAHVPCALSNHWVLNEEEFKASCPRHA